MRLEISTPPGSDLSGFALSPDGRHLVYEATVVSSRRRLSP
jgi:hypothetical protein